MAGYHAKSINTTFATSLQFVNYGNIVQTDAGGNVQGSFKPSDLSWQVTASRQYEERWHYGLTLKYIRSRYQQYRSTGFSADLGIAYLDSANGWQAGLVAKNMGAQIKSYGVQDKEPLPFDLQIGISKSWNMCHCNCLLLYTTFTSSILTMQTLTLKRDRSSKTAIRLRIMQVR
ncbi:PorV/PorQ family protein [Chitinophaga sedimenti]|nr:PorV/PorQ family protein [Chitinophaga sedimenti]